MFKFILITFLSTQALFSYLLPITQTSYSKVYNTFGKKAIDRVRFIQHEIGKISTRTTSTYTKLSMVNQLINKISYKKDYAHWGNDFNATLVELIASGAGDSLDFAFAKYTLLVKLGLDPKKFRFFQTKRNINSKLYDQKYYVLGYYADNKKDLMVLDCYTNELTLIKPQYSRKYKEVKVSLYTRRSMENKMYSYRL